MNIFLNKKNFYLFILFYSLLAIFFALYIEYILQFKPCKLCLFERIPYILAIIIINIKFLFKKYEKIYLLLISLIFASATLLSFYHFGIEQGFIEESMVCDLNNQNNSLNVEDILNQLKENTISCKDVTFRLLGLSLATINTITSLIISVITINIFLNYEKNK